jgi:hypothetical protein
MKKFLLFLALTTLFWSCKRPNDIKPNEINSEPTKGILSGADNKWDVLGYGIDITGNLHDIGSVSDAPIVDVNRFAADYLSRIDVNNTTEGSEDLYFGATALDYLKDVTTKKSAGVSGNYGFGGDDKSLSNTGKYVFTASLSKNSSDQNRTSYSSRYSYATYDVVQRVRRLQFTGDASTDLLMTYITPEFVYNVANMSADALVARYGTHILLGINIGGVLKFDYSGSILSSSDYTKKTSDVKVGLGFGLLKVVGVNINTDKSTEEVNQTTYATTSREYKAKFYGGTNSGKSISIDKDGNPSESINIGAWQQSVNPSNAALIGVTKLVFLYDFIADPDKKAQVKVAVEKYINDNQPQMLNDDYPRAPFYRYVNTRSLDHLYTSNPTEVLGQSVWQSEGTEGYIYTTQVDNLIPLYRFFINGFHFYTTSRNEVENRYYEGIAGFVNPVQRAGEVPFYRYNAKSKAAHGHFYTTNWNELSYGGADWTYEGIVGYLSK